MTDRVPRRQIAANMQARIDALEAENADLQAGVAALRAALAAQPQPLYDETVTAVSMENTQSDLLRLLRPGVRIVVYPAVAGSVTPALSEAEREADVIRDTGA